MGILKQWRQRRVVRKHIATHGGFAFRGRPIELPGNLKLNFQELIADERYEAAEANLIDRFLPRNLPVVELGGCLGLISGHIARRLEAACELIVVEANPALADICLRNASLFGAKDNVRVINKAIAYGAATVAFRHSGNVHGNRMVDPANYRTISVETTTLGDVAALLGQSATFSLVCDIEGAEADMIASDRAVLERCAVAIIELHPSMYDDAGTSDALVRQLHGAGLVQVAQEDDVAAFVNEGLVANAGVAT